MMNNIKSARLSKGLTGEELGILIGVQKSAVSKYERDEIQPSKDILLKMADILEVTTDYLLGRTDNPNPHDKSLIVPAGMERVLTAFGPDLEDLTQEEADNLAAIHKTLKAQRKERAEKNGQA